VPLVGIVAPTATERKTARSRLRRIAADDLAAIVAIRSDPRTNRHRPGGFNVSR
jgi:hypothetical protein